VFVQAGVFVTDNRKTPVYFEICPFANNYESVRFYSTAPNSLKIVIRHSKNNLNSNISLLINIMGSKRRKQSGKTINSSIQGRGFESMQLNLYYLNMCVMRFLNISISTGFFASVHEPERKMKKECFRRPFGWFKRLHLVILKVQLLIYDFPLCSQCTGSAIDLYTMYMLGFL
jgi:hypothetical protein